MKACKCCNQSKPLNLYHKDSGSVDGHKFVCKACISEKGKAKRDADPQKFLERSRNHREKNADELAEYHRKYRVENREKVKAWQKNHQEKNKDQIAKRQKQYYEQNKERLYLESKKWEAANPDRVAAKSKKYRETHLEKVKSWAKGYREANRGLFSFHAMKRNAEKIKRTPSWLTNSDHLRIKCLYQLAAMRRKETGQDWHVDHIIPLRGKLVSGLHVPNNLQVIPASENRQKKNNFAVA